MKLAMSQFAWPDAEEEQTLAMLKSLGYAGVEIAPTRVAGKNPYHDYAVASAYARKMKEQWGFAVCSMQSLWFGVEGNIFGQAQPDLLAYTQKAICFAQAADCPSMVFGSPKNRNMPQGKTPADVLPFFKTLGDAAAAHDTHLLLEANPDIYGTNFMNTTPQALDYVKQVNSPGFKINLDVGTMVQNGENVELLQGQLAYVGHVHISEPFLAPVQNRPLHQELAQLLRNEGYTGYISIEMKECAAEVRRQVAEYVAEVFS